MPKVRAPDLFPQRQRHPNPQRDAYLRAHPLIDPAILADALGITERTVRHRQRKLGLRLCVNHTTIREMQRERA